eukprot:4638972-Amphidinium_carterae.1
MRKRVTAKAWPNDIKTHFSLKWESVRRANMHWWQARLAHHITSHAQTTLQDRVQGNSWRPD